MATELYYRRIYQYQLEDNLEAKTTVRSLLAELPHPRKRPDDSLPWIRLTPDGTIAIRKGYSWNGASGPAVDTDDLMRASLVHDALYQMIEEGVIPLKCRKQADVTLRKICKEDGMGWFRRWYVYLAVRTFGWLWMHPPKKGTQ